MKIIILNEKQNTGKSSVIREVRNLLLKNGVLLWEYPKKLSKHIDPINCRKEIISIIKYDGKIIGLCSRGDTPNLIQKTFYNLFYHSTKLNKKLDFLICASRNYDSSAFNNLKAIMNYIDYIQLSKSNGKEIKIYSLEHYKIYKKGKTKFDVFRDAKIIYSNI